MTHYSRFEIQNDIKQCLPSCEKSIIESAKRFFRKIQLWSDRAEERKQLAEVDDRLLKDMGISRIDAEQESAKPFWR